MNVFSPSPGGFISHSLALNHRGERKEGEQTLSLSLCFAMSGYTSTWVQCDNPGCLKWRRISRAAAEALGEQQW